ncbi:hypothetical protein ACEN9J_02910 [Variovorax sp. Varisp41]|uniref:hypothetical protein n=1 Tax=Variovorax sp. Varisp41 TaxID=3243033 RepID=UPI0039B5CBF9
MRKLWGMAFAVGAVVLTACSSGQGEAETAVRGLLNDPDSAKFTGVKPGTDKGSYCGFVNAKNRMGGYGGPTPFFYEKSTGLAGIVAPVADRDFRSLWLAIQAGSASDEVAEVGLRCLHSGRWKAVCGTEYPATRDRLCLAMDGDGKDLYEQLKAQFGG